MSGDDVVEAHILETPEAFLVTDADPESDEWFEARRGGVTATDIPKILGYTRYGNALSVYMDKRGELDDFAGEEAYWGTVFEAPVAGRWAHLNDTQVSKVGVLANTDHQWRRASLDRLVDPCPDGGHYGCGLEVKTRSAWVEERYRDGIPDDVWAQVLWQLSVTGLDHMHVAVLVGGQRLRQFRVDRDEQVETFLIAQATPVWQAVVDGVEPDVEPDDQGILLDLLDRVHPDRAGARELDAVEAVGWVEQYMAGSDLARQGAKLKTQAKTGLVKMLDDADTGLVGGVQQFTYRRPRPGWQMDADAIRRLQAADPELFAMFVDNGTVTPTSTSPRFTLTKRETT